MLRPRTLLILLAAVLALALAGCSRTPAAPTEAPTATTAPATATPVPPTATPEPPAATEAPSSKPGTGLPDPKTDPVGALLYISTPDLMKSAEFTYTMTMALKPGDEESAKVLEPILSQIESGLGQMTGEGALEIIDAQAGKVHMRMTLNMQTSGQEITVDTVTVDGSTWIRTGTGQEWQKADPATAGLSPGMDPASLTEMAKAASDVKYVEETKLDGDRVHVLSYSLDPKKTDFEKLLQSAGASGLGKEELTAMLKGMTVQADMWLRASDLLVRQLRMVLAAPLPLPAEAGMENVKLLMKVDMTMRYFNLNEPVTIEAPEP